MKTALALDCGWNTGWCRSDGRCGTFSIREFDDHGQAFAAWQDWLDCELRDNPTSLLVIERMEFGRAHNADLMITLVRAAHAVAWSHCVPRTERSAAQVRKWLCGTAKASDPQILAEVQARGFAPQNEHQADAAALLCMAMDIKREARAA